MKRSTLNFSLSVLLFSVTFLACKKQDQATSIVDQPAQSDTWNVDTASLTMPRSNGLVVNSGDLANGQTPTIVILGSSTAEGTGASAKNLSWVELLRSKLSVDKKNVNVINLGLGGQTTFNIMPANYATPADRGSVNTTRNITSALSYHPFLIILNMPTNDVAYNYTDDEIMSNFKRVTSMMDSARVNYILTGTQPRNFPTLEQRKRLKTLNDKILIAFPGHTIDFLRKLSKSGYQIADFYSYTDGIHLNDNGHRIIYQYIFNSSLFQKLTGYIDPSSDIEINN